MRLASCLPASGSDHIPEVAALLRRRQVLAGGRSKAALPPRRQRERAMLRRCLLSRSQPGLLPSAVPPSKRFVRGRKRSFDLDQTATLDADAETIGRVGCIA